MASGILPVPKVISLDVGFRMLVVGVNSTGVPGKFHGPGEHRCKWMDVGTAKHMDTLPGENFSVLIINNRIDPNVVDRILGIAEHAKTKQVLLVENSSAIQQLMEAFPVGEKGVITIEVPGVVQEIEVSQPKFLPAKKASVSSAQPPLIPQAPEQPLVSVSETVLAESAVVSLPLTPQKQALTDHMARLMQLSGLLNTARSDIEGLVVMTIELSNKVGEQQKLLDQQARKIEELGAENHRLKAKLEKAAATLRTD